MVDNGQWQPMGNESQQTMTANGGMADNGQWQPMGNDSQWAMIANG